MTIGKGTIWGRPGVLNAHSPTFDTDTALARYLAGHLGEHFHRIALEELHEYSEENLGPLAVPPIGLTGGALWRTIGGPGSVGRYATNEARHYPCDLAIAEADGIRHVFVASLVARNLWWTKTVVVMNAQDMGTYRFGHRAHPGDAVLDIYEAHVPFADVWKIARRAKLGSHLPHPGISERRLPSSRFQFEQPRQLWLDEQRVGNVQQLSVSVVPDAFTVEV